jgi:NAD(P)-dependent dehydrogenase (short-subunit alcohol dehydrogenase family)
MEVRVAERPGRLDNKIALITGAATGLGRVAAELFAREGAEVVVADVVDGNDAVDAIIDAGGSAAYVATDVTDDASVAAAVEFAVETFGGLHVLYNNAGISPGDDDGPTNTSDETWTKTLDVNVTGIARCCRHGIPALIAAGGGSIVNVASFVAHVGAATPQIAYTASKGAVLSMTREIAVIYARQGIRANALCPGPVLTPLLAKFLSDDAKRQRRLVHVPMGRFGEPIEIANGALFLASDESSFMTGQSLLIDGGITAAYTTPE